MLTSFERRWLLTICDTIIPSDSHDELTAGASAAPLGAFFDDVFARSPVDMRAGIRAATWVITWLPLFWRLKLRPFGRLRREDRVALLTSLAGSRFYLVREIPNLLKIIACMGWSSMPAVQAQLGMPNPDATPPDWVTREAAR